MAEHIKNKREDFCKKYSNTELFKLLNNFSSDDEMKSGIKCEESVYYDSKKDDSEPTINDEEFFKIFDKVFDLNDNPKM